MSKRFRKEKSTLLRRNNFTKNIQGFRLQSLSLSSFSIYVLHGDAGGIVIAMMVTTIAITDQIARRVPVDPVGPLHIFLLAEVVDPLAAVKSDENGNRLQKNIDPMCGSWLTDFKIFNIVEKE